MTRLWQVGIGIALATVCLTIAETQTDTRNTCYPGKTIMCGEETYQTGFGTILVFVGWFLVICAAANLINFFRGK